MMRQAPSTGANRGRQCTALMGPGHRNTNSRSSPARSIDPTSAPAVSLTETRFAAFEGSHESVEQRPLTLEEFHVASATENQPTRSISGYSLMLPDPFGHSSSNVLLTVPSRSRSPRTANAVMTLPLGCFNGAKSMRGPSGAGLPSSSANSRCATVHGSSPSTYSPFGIDHAPSSLRAQNGPPGWPISTSMPPSVTRYSSRPALSFGIRQTWVG